MLAGPDPREIYPAPSWPDLQAALLGEIRFVDARLADAPTYCVLNACRILFSFETRNVVMSKQGAAARALGAVPAEHHDLMRAAMRVYTGRGYGRG